MSIIRFALISKLSWLQKDLAAVALVRVENDTLEHHALKWCDRMRQVCHDACIKLGSVPITRNCCEEATKCLEEGNGLSVFTFGKQLAIVFEILKHGIGEKLYREMMKRGCCVVCFRTTKTIHVLVPAPTPPDEKGIATPKRFCDNRPNSCARTFS